MSYVCLLQTCQDKAQISAGSMMLTVIARLFAVKQIKRPYSASTEPSSSLATLEEHVAGLCNVMDGPYEERRAAHMRLQFSCTGCALWT